MLKIESKKCISKEPDYHNNYYQNNKDKYKSAKKKSYAITKCGLNCDIAEAFKDNAIIVGRFQKIYLKLKGECPEALEFMIQYLAETNDENDEEKKNDENQI